MKVNDPNIIPATVALSSVSPGNLIATANGKRFLVLASGAQVDCDTNASVGMAGTTQVFDHGPATVSVAEL